MLNILSYIGVSVQSELCLWTLLGLLRTIFDATLFKVNANLKQVWQMSMPPEISKPIQRFLRTMISGVMLVKCFTVYVYLASYIVLLYPVFLEERPTLVLPWLLLAAIRKLLCELTSLALGLGTCLMIGPARTPCIRFVVFKAASITPAFYMWMLVFSYYNALKLASTFKRFPAAIASSDHDYGLELAVRRRRTKSLQGEEQLRKKLVASFNYGETSESQSLSAAVCQKTEITSRMVHSTHANFEDIQAEMQEPALTAVPLSTDREMSDLGSYEDWLGSEIVVPRDTDRILEQFTIMMLRIGAYIKAEITDPETLFNAQSRNRQSFDMDCSTLQPDEAETPPLVGKLKGKTASYLQNYPDIFMKRPNENLQKQADKFEVQTAEVNDNEANLLNEYNQNLHEKISAKTKAQEIIGFSTVVNKEEPTTSKIYPTDEPNVNDQNITKQIADGINIDKQKSGQVKEENATKQSMHKKQGEMSYTKSSLQPGTISIVEEVMATGNERFSQPFEKKSIESENNSNNSLRIDTQESVTKGHDVKQLFEAIIRSPGHKLGAKMSTSKVESFNEKNEDESENITIKSESDDSLESIIIKMKAIYSESSQDRKNTQGEGTPVSTRSINENNQNHSGPQNK